MADWKEIKTEYISTDISYRRLAEKHQVSRGTLEERAKREGWVALRKEHRELTVNRALETISQDQSQKILRVASLTDRLLEKLEQAVQELDVHLLKRSTKVKEIEYQNDQRPDKPTREIIREEEEYAHVSAYVDRAGLKQITSALKDIKEVQMLRTELDRQEQEARIDKLRLQVRKDDRESQGVQVLLGEGLEELAQ